MVIWYLNNLNVGYTVLLYEVGFQDVTLVDWI